MNKLLGSLALLLVLGGVAQPQGDPTIISVDPDSARWGDMLWVSIIGQATHFDQGSPTIVWFSQESSTINASSVNVGSATNLQAYFGIPVGVPLGQWDVHVNYLTGAVGLTGGFRILPQDLTPRIIVVAPDSAFPGDNLWVTIIGQNTSFSQGSSTIMSAWFSQASSTIITASSVNVYTPTGLEAFFGIPVDVQVGPWDVCVSGTTQPLVTLPGGFRVKFLCGDTNRDTRVNVTDAVFLINYVFVPGSPAPSPLACAEVNCDGRVNIPDAVYIINYVFAPGSPAPCANCP